MVLPPETAAAPNPSNLIRVMPAKGLEPVSPEPKFPGSPCFEEEIHDARLQ